MKSKIIFILLSGWLIAASCDYLDQQSDTIFTDEQVFRDPVLIKAVLANFYGRSFWSNGEYINDIYSYMYLDDAGYCIGGPLSFTSYGTAYWRVYDYTLIRNINEFIRDLRNTSALSDAEKNNLEGEARFLRAWCYFNMCRSLGGVPIVGDEVFEYQGGGDITPLQIARSTEEQTYDYIISECAAAAGLLDGAKTVNNARANVWTARMLEARAALYAASIGKYNNLMPMPITTDGGEVGISQGRVNEYYNKALSAARDVIENSPYVLQDNHPADKGRNFYEAVTVKANNTEMIWVRDFSAPQDVQTFTHFCMPISHSEDDGASRMGIILNLVEQFEPVNTSTPGEGSKIVTTEGGGYKFYATADEPFADRDPRLWGTVIYPGAEFKGTEVPLQTGQLNRDANGNWVTRVARAGTVENGITVTSINGPEYSAADYINKTGFYIRKYLDETPGASTFHQKSEVWMPRFRMAEAYLIAAEAAMELNQSDALQYINAVRVRAGVQPLTSLTIDRIIHERRVEFALEDHRYWDLRRLRRAHEVWNGDPTSDEARPRILWPYLVVAPGDPEDGHWVFIEDYSFMLPNALYFQLQNYYAFFDQSWLNRNPKLVKNPYQ